MKKFMSLDHCGSLFQANNRLFVLGRENTVFDVTEKKTPTFLDTFALPKSEYGTSLDLAYKQWVFFNVGYEGLYLLDLAPSNKLKPVKLLPLPYPQLKFKHLHGDYFVSNTDIFKMEESQRLEVVWKMFEGVFDIYSYEHHIYLGCKDEGLKVFDISTLEAPQLVSHPFGNFFCSWIDHFHDRIIIVKSELNDVLFFVDIDQPDRPVLLSEIRGRAYPYKNFFIQYPYVIVYVYETEKVLKVFDCSSPKSPRVVCTYPISHRSRITHNGSFIAVWGSDQPANTPKLPLEVLKITKEGKLIKVMPFSQEPEIYSVALLENYLYVTKGDGAYVSQISESD